MPSKRKPAGASGGPSERDLLGRRDRAEDSQYVARDQRLNRIADPIARAVAALAQHTGEASRLDASRRKAAERRERRTHSRVAKVRRTAVAASFRASAAAMAGRAASASGPR